MDLSRTLPTIALLLILLLASCGTDSDVSSDTLDYTAQARVIYESPADADEAAIVTNLQAAGDIEALVAFINETFELPQPLDIIFGGEYGPLYDPETNEIYMPYTFLTEVEERFAAAEYTDSMGVTAEEITTHALMHTLFHELAHALIAMYELPVVGREEDAADSLATLLLIEFYEDGQDIAISAADLFNLESADRTEFDEEDFWSEHSLDAQRYYSILCHVYGSDPKQYDHIRIDTGFSDDRAELCIEEYEVLARNWFVLLDPYMLDAAQ